MSFYGKKSQLLALGLSFPSSILAMAFIVFKLRDEGFLSTPVAFGLLMLFVVYLIWMLVWFSKKKKS